jgi:4-amino-4-deoxy-L-arabinose transferase-like glycosyltransferase
LFAFGFNEEYQASLAKSIVNDFHPIWIGVSAAHLDFYTGPLFTYFTAFWLYVSGGDPLITSYVSAGIGIISCMLVFWLGRLVFNYWTAITAAILYAASPLLVFYDQKYWNPTPNTLLSLIVIISTVLAQKNRWWWAVFFACFSLIFHADLAAGPVVIPGLWLFIKQIRLIPKRVILWSLSVFLLIYSPLLVFDYHHNFSNLTTPFRLGGVIKDIDNSASLGNHALVLANSVSRLWYLNFNPEATDESLATCDPLPFGLGRVHRNYPNNRTIPGTEFQFITVLLCAIYLSLICFDKEWNVRFLGWVVIVFLTLFMFFPGGTFEYYLLTIYPLLLFLPGYLYTKVTGWPRLTIIVWVIIVVVLGIISILTAKAEYGLSVKKELIAEVSMVTQKRPFELWERGQCHGLEGWRYLFRAYGQVPVKASIDSTLGWIYPNEISSNPKSEVQVVIVESRYPMRLESLHPLESTGTLNESIKLLKVITKGGFTAYVFDIAQTGSVWD